MTGYCISAINIAISRITQMNLMKHPMHIVMPLPKSTPRNPKSCIPQPRMPRSTNIPIPINMISSIVISPIRIISFTLYNRSEYQFTLINNSKMGEKIYKINETELVQIGSICIDLNKK